LTWVILLLTLHNRIIPQAISVRYGLYVRAACAPLVLILMFLFSEFSLSILCFFVQLAPSAPVAYPIAKKLDYVLRADKHQTYKKAELKSFLQFHRTGEEPLRDQELAILNSVLELNTKDVERIMTPLRVCAIPFGTDKPVLLIPSIGCCDSECG
jgi:metal transporter CNNM